MSGITTLAADTLGPVGCACSCCLFWHIPQTLDWLLDLEGLKARSASWAHFPQAISDKFMQCVYAHCPAGGGPCPCCHIAIMLRWVGCVKVTFR